MDISKNDISTLKREDLSYLEDLLFDENRTLKIVSYEDLKNIPQEHISQFCVDNGIYSLPTMELIDFLKEEIGSYHNKTIEVGAGNGVVANALDIIATDSYQQIMPKYRKIYEVMKQPIVKYGKNVEKCNANKSIKKYKPKCVLAQWITHVYKPNEHWRGGNEIGINEADIIWRVQKYIFVGNEHTHRHKRILDIPHRTVKSDWLLSRGIQKEKNVIWIWDKEGV